RPKFSEMLLACPMWRYPLGSGGKRVATLGRPSGQVPHFFDALSASMICLMKWRGRSAPVSAAPSTMAYLREGGMVRGEGCPLPRQGLMVNRLQIGDRCGEREGAEIEDHGACRIGCIGKRTQPQLKSIGHRHLHDLGRGRLIVHRSLGAGLRGKCNRHGF